MPKYPEEVSFPLAVAHALESISPMKRAIAEKAQIYGGCHVLALLACLVLAFYSGWVRWVAEFFVLISLINTWCMRNALSQLQSYMSTAHPGGLDAVLWKHRILNYVALLLMSYAVVAILVSWSGCMLSVFLVMLINMVHYAGYRGSGA